MSKRESNFSENEDDPDANQSSGDEWKEDKKKKSSQRRSSQRLSKKPKVTHIDDSDSDLDDPKPRGRNGVHKKPKTGGTPGRKPKEAPVTTVEKVAPAGTTFMTGTFVILKKDAQSGDPLKHPCIWKIDGKALLQKYEPFEEEGKVRHRNTSIYTGWSPLDIDLYSAIKVQVIFHAGQKMVVELDWEQLKEINDDSE